MEKVVILIFIFLGGMSTSFSQKNYFVSINGNDSYSGSVNEPFATWQKGISVTEPGDTVFIEGGVYYPDAYADDRPSYYGVYVLDKNGTKDAPIVICALPGERPVLNCSKLSNTSRNRGIYIRNSSYLSFIGFDITNVKQNNSSELPAGIIGSYVNNITLIGINSYDNNGVGIRFEQDCNNVVIRNCDSYNNYDILTSDVGENADGIEFAYVPDGNTNYIVGCRMWNNSDDGLDLWQNNGVVYIDSCWTWSNGKEMGDGNGFKLGQSTITPDPSKTYRYLRHCIAADISYNGVTDNNANFKAEIYNNTFYNCATNIQFYTNSQQNIFANNLIIYGGSVVINSESERINRSSDYLDTDNLSSEFQSLDVTELSEPRDENYNLPEINFLRPVATSSIVDKGVSVGLSYYGEGPEFGANEYIDKDNTCEDFSVSGEVVNTDYEQNNGSITLTASGGSDPYSYTWVDNSTDMVRSGLGANTYTVEVNDAGDCSITKSFVVEENSIIITDITIIDGELTSEFTTSGDCSNVTCTIYDESNVVIYGPVDNVESGFVVSISEVCDNCEDGTYRLVLSSEDIVATQEISYLKPSDPCIDFSVSGEVTNTDYEQNNGSITLTASGGTVPYSYTWVDNSTDMVRSGLGANTYTVEVNDAGDCSITKSFVVEENSIIITDISIIDGELTSEFTTSGDCSNVTCTIYDESNVVIYGPVDNVESGFVVSIPEVCDNCEDGTYSLVLTSEDVVATQYVSYLKPGNPCIGFSVSGEVVNTDYEQNNGSITLTASGGSEPYSYTWVDNSTDMVRSGLGANTYTVEVNDAGDCSITKSFVVEEEVDPCLSFSVSSQIYDATYEKDDGMITLSVSGGVEPYVFSWNDGEVVQNREKLSVGSYSVEVSDNNDCMEQLSFTIDYKEISLEINKFYPNPTKGLIAIEFISPIQTTAEIIVENLDGDNIKSISVNCDIGKNKETIDIAVDKDGNQNPSGRYFIILRQGQDEDKIEILKR